MPTEHVSVVLDRIAQALNRKNNDVVTAPSYKIIDIATRKHLSVGDRVKLHQGRSATLVAWEAPTHEGSTGRVYVETKDGVRRSYSPSVIRAEIIEVSNG